MMTEEQRSIGFEMGSATPSPECGFLWWRRAWLYVVFVLRRGNYFRQVSGTPTSIRALMWEISCRPTLTASSAAGGPRISHPGGVPLARSQPMTFSALRSQVTWNNLTIAIIHL